MKNAAMITDSQLVASRIVLHGTVQGVGMRPAVARLARNVELTGFVRNSSSGVEIQIEGFVDHVEQFVVRLLPEIPAIAAVHAIDEQAAFRVGFTDFRILPSHGEQSPTSTSVPADMSICQRCRSEVMDNRNIRFGYPFTSCTDCGPRYSLIRSMPYDRNATSMIDFELCDSCHQEYSQSPADRRFHSQINACPECGPGLVYLHSSSTAVQNGFEAVHAAAMAIRQGMVVALKGIGGYQLVCDATSDSAVRRLRERKCRSGKPLAVMVEGVDAAMRLAKLRTTERQTLADSGNPIVLLTSREASVLSRHIHPNLGHVGIMVPSSGLHLVLVREVGGPCVVTSGNVDGAPLGYREADSGRFKTLADGCLSHNREIVRPIDDSVVKCVGDHRIVIRAARGLAPLQLRISANKAILAVGGHQKVALAISNGRQSVLGPHIGDMHSVAARQRFVEQVEQIKQLYRVVHPIIVHDMHPDFFTTQWASKQARENAIHTIAVQHHHAHVVAGMVEHDWLDREVLGVAFDGTGYGTDGTVWGGEFLLCTAAGFRRVARIRPLALPGGEQCVREPWRTAMAVLQDATNVQCAMDSLSWAGSDTQRRRLSGLLRSGPSIAGSALTSSVGRLFDGVASILLHIAASSYEGEPAMRLEAICDPSATGEYTMPLVDGEIIEIDWRPMIRNLLSDQKAGVLVQVLATRFTRGLARAIADVAGRFSEFPVVLSGGCFQNSLLTEETSLMLGNHPQPVGLPGIVPCNDGGLSAGQLAVAASVFADYVQEGV